MVLQAGRRTDVVFMAPAQMETVDIISDDSDTWMYRCHFDDQVQAGRAALYKVEP